MTFIDKFCLLNLIKQVFFEAFVTLATTEFRVTRALSFFFEKKLIGGSLFVDDF